MIVLYLPVGNSGVYWIPEFDRHVESWACACMGPNERSLPGECNCGTWMRKRNERREIVGLPKQGGHDAPLRST